MDIETPDQIATLAKPRLHGEADALMAQMAQYIDVTRLQFKRLSGDLADYGKLSRPDPSVRVYGDHLIDEHLGKSRETRTALFADLHFLLIYIHETDKILTKLKTLFPQESDLSNLRNRNRTLLKRCADFRLHMEHFDKNNGVEDFGSLKGTEFKFHGKSFDLGPGFEKDAEVFFGELMSVWSRISDRQRKIRDLISRGPHAS